jgi:hypothetical protein
MTYPVIHTCPVCTHELHVTKLKCRTCQTVIENDFTLTKFATLTKEQMHFVEIFVVNRGNIKEVEKALGISYPTVRGKLNEVIAKLDPDKSGEEQGEQLGKSKIIAMLENEEISPEEAITLMKNKKE